MIRFENMQFRYDPFPLGVVSGLFSDSDYQELVSTYPPPELFKLETNVGRRYTLASHIQPFAYRAHLRRNPAWRELYRLVTGRTYFTSMIEMLLDHHVDLGIPVRGLSASDWLWRLARNLRFGQAFSLRTRPQGQLIFAMLPADGGCLLPHTDTPLKLLNLAATMTPAGEWDSSYGGGTDVNWPKQVRRRFNRTNKPLSFDEVDILDTVPFRPNQALLVVRSDTSWHSIRPMTQTGSPLLRKTVNLNLLGYSI